MNYQILQGDNRETLKTIPDNSIDAIVTDPPYGIDFLGKSWDANTGAIETYQECLRVLKPGGHIVAFSAARTYHHLAITLEQAGFEIRDQIMWIYSSGFPKSQDIGKSIERTEKKRKDNALGIKRSKIESGPKTCCPKCNKTLNGTNQSTCAEVQCDLRDALKPADNEWAGWGTQLKPAHEPIALARKPIKLSIAKNCQEHGVGALNIDATRVPFEDENDAAAITDWKEKWGGNQTGGAPVFQGSTVEKKKKSDKEKALNWTPQRQQAGDTTEIGTFGASGLIGKEVPMYNAQGRFPANVIGEIEGYQKYFYCPKVNSKERMTFNNHPTVKPIELMKYLIKLITPAGGTVLDPFNGSGSTGCAAVELGHPYIGCELDPAYVDIAIKRIEAWHADCNPTTFTSLFTHE